MSTRRSWVRAEVEGDEEDIVGGAGEADEGARRLLQEAAMETGPGVKATLNTRAPTDATGSEATGADQPNRTDTAPLRTRGKYPTSSRRTGEVPVPKLDKCADTVSAELGHRAISQTVRKQSSANRPPEVPSSSRVLARPRPLKPLSSGQCGLSTK